MAVTLKGQTAVYEGTSTDTKPTDADNNSIFIELDTDKRYYYDGTDWNEMPSSGSGGGFTPTSTQLAAMNSGITAEDVTQIETNENNIAAIKDGTNIDSFGDVETALGDKADADNVYKLALTDADLLPANTDLDNVKTVGCYFVYTSADVSTITNRPVTSTSAFRLTVDYGAGKNRPRQTYKSYSSYDTYVRSTNSSDVWSDWKKVECDLSTKQDTISDLSTIRSGAAAGATAVQPATMETALDAKQDTLTTEQLAAVNSGIDSTKVGQIETNKNNIIKDEAALVELVDSGAKNKLSIGIPASVPTGLTCERNGDGTYTVSGTLATANSITFNIDAISGDLVLSGCPQGGGNDTYLLRITKSGSQVAGSVDTGNGSDVFAMDGTGYALNIRFAAGTYTNVIFSPMICSKAAWDISHSYVPYRPSYDELIARVEALENV